MVLESRHHVSIHTPAWGVTIFFAFNKQQFEVSIHTPAWGVTGLLLRNHQVPVCFNPHSRVGSDVLRAWLCCALDCFNPHSRVGSDFICFPFHFTLSGFNPHSRVGSDGWRLSPSRCLSCFNPHSRVGSDVWLVVVALIYAVPIHTPACGVTVLLVLTETPQPFQSTLPRGE